MSSACNPNLLLSIGGSSGQIKDQHNTNDAIDDSITNCNLSTSGRGAEGNNHNHHQHHHNHHHNSTNCISSSGTNAIQSTTINNNINSSSSNNNNNNSSKNNTISNSTSNYNANICSTTNSTVGSVCATVAFMDIKSASKAHTAEHKIDDRLLTTEYYEPSSIPSTSGENSPSSNSSLAPAVVLATGSVVSSQTIQIQQQHSPPHQLHHIQGQQQQLCSIVGSGSIVTGSGTSVQPPQQYSSATVSPPTVSGHRLSTSNHG